MHAGGGTGRQEHVGAAVLHIGWPCRCSRAHVCALCVCRCTCALHQLAGTNIYLYIIDLCLKLVGCAQGGQGRAPVELPAPLLPPTPPPPNTPTLVPAHSASLCSCRMASTSSMHTFISLRISSLYLRGPKEGGQQVNRAGGEGGSVTDRAGVEGRQEPRPTHDRRTHPE